MSQSIQDAARAGLAGALVAVAMAVTFVAEKATAADAVPDAPAQQIWLLSTRQAPRGGNLEAAGECIKYWRHSVDQRGVEQRGVEQRGVEQRGVEQRTGNQCGGNQRWEPALAKELIDESDPAIPTVVFVHGNWVDLNDAVRAGWPVYSHLRRCAEGRPFRFIIWAWPADRIGRGVRGDARIKARYSDAQSYYLADWLGRHAPNGSVNLIGYSFGARVVTGTLQLLAGGRVAGRSLPHETNRQHGPLRAVLIAAALDADWLLPNRRNGLALSQVDRLLITKNLRDPVLKWYPLMNGHRGSEALGHSGPVCRGQLGPEGEKIEVYNITNSVGRAHAWTKHLASAGLRRQLTRFTFPEPPPTKP